MAPSAFGVPGCARRDLIPLVHGEEGAKNGAGEFSRQDVHVDLVPKTSEVPTAFPAPADLAEAGFLIAAAAGVVVLEDHQHDVVQAENGEGVVEEEPHRLCPIAASPRVRLADHDANERAPV